MALEDTGTVRGPSFTRRLEGLTAEAEVKHNSFVRMKVVAQKTGLHRIELAFSGSIRDLRMHRDDWPFLTDESLTECQSLAGGAIEEGNAALLAPSARCEGSTLPIFVQNSITRVVAGGVVSVDAP